MKKLVVLLVFHSALYSYSQQGSIRIGPSGSIESTHFDFNKHQLNSNADLSGGPKVGVGLSIQVGLTDRITLFTGAKYSRLDFLVDHNYDPNSPFASILPKKTWLRTRSVAIPLSVGYRVEAGAVELMPMLGGSLEILMSEEEESSYVDGDLQESDGYESDLNSPHLLLNCGLLVSFGITDNLHLGLGPTVALGTSTLDEVYVEGPEFNWGGFFQVVYSIHRAP